jgi:hypothetical protein
MCIHGYTSNGPRPGAWFTVDRWQRGQKGTRHSSAVTGARPPATQGHGSSQVGVQKQIG